jgi:hypothetical protein
MTSFSLVQTSRRNTLHTSPGQNIMGEFLENVNSYLQGYTASNPKLGYHSFKIVVCFDKSPGIKPSIACSYVSFAEILGLSSIFPSKVLHAMSYVSCC